MLDIPPWAKRHCEQVTGCLALLATSCLGCAFAAHSRGPAKDSHPPPLCGLPTSYISNSPALQSSANLVQVRA